MTWQAGETIYSATALRCPAHGRMNTVRIGPDGRDDYRCRKCGARLEPTAGPALYRARFTFDFWPEGEGVEGWTDGDNWNGWAVPYFTREQGERVAAIMDRLVAAEGGVDAEGLRLSYDAARDAFLTGNPNFDRAEPVSDENPTQETYGRAREWMEPGTGAALYSIGGYSWCWINTQDEEEEA